MHISCNPQDRYLKLDVSPVLDSGVSTATSLMVNSAWTTVYASCVQLAALQTKPPSVTVRLSAGQTGWTGMTLQVSETGKSSVITIPVRHVHNQLEFNAVRRTVKQTGWSWAKCISATPILAVCALTTSSSMEPHAVSMRHVSCVTVGCVCDSLQHKRFSNSVCVHFITLQIIVTNL